MNDLQYLLGQNQAGEYTTEDWHNNFDDNLKVDRILKLAQRQVLPTNYCVKAIYAGETDLEYFQITIVIGFANGEFADERYEISIPKNTDPKLISRLLNTQINLYKSLYGYRFDRGLLLSRRGFKL